MWLYCTRCFLNGRNYRFYNFSPNLIIYFFFFHFFFVWPVRFIGSQTIFFYVFEFIYLFLFVYSLLLWEHLIKLSFKCWPITDILPLLYRSPIAMKPFENNENDLENGFDKDTEKTTRSTRVTKIPNQALLSGLAYCISSCSMILVNKFVLSSYDFNAGIFLMLYQVIQCNWCSLYEIEILDFIWFSFVIDNNFVGVYSMPLKWLGNCFWYDIYQVDDT